MSMFWMPKIQSVFNVIPALACNGVSKPYWESNFVYPLDNGGKPPTTTTTTKGSTKTTTAGSTPTSGDSCTPGSKGLSNGDGYNGYDSLLNVAFHKQQGRKTNKNLLLDPVALINLIVSMTVSLER